MRYCLHVAGALMFLAIIGCKMTGNGIEDRKFFQNATVDELEIVGPWRVVVNCGAVENKCAVVADENFWEYIDFSYDVKFLAKFKERSEIKVPMQIMIWTVESIKKATLGGGVSVKINNNKTVHLNVELSGDSQLEMENANVKRALFKLKDNAGIKFSGLINILNYHGEDRSHGNIEQVDFLKLQLGGQAVLQVSLVNKYLRGELNNKTVLSYGGAGRIDLQKAADAVVNGPAEDLKKSVK